mmetsp:Transcript_50437/g.163205  ORF Transcript_50437/g.163205 Transcript_50437/m.163205 type:complete len:874 (-) Transcript_50437:66-2687(-)|eukprot:CAMPEP_0203918506 /NCGR_PEP_ID=MMETSP0359-20131031/59031_1 /ASSEMBLY_ACC=CAM_ASM_000338 /TAXON_ID=268821 /ORGANISM="Scrippsiella Hangoei, Strain SHTV-5" /LENGTH=873 /DNA_ID=CAMNT_0050845619 /DNA_START=81 /DNA_END=2702 /DNA_ORIENTATION=-
MANKRLLTGSEGQLRASSGHNAARALAAGATAAATAAAVVSQQVAAPSGAASAWVSPIASEMEAAAIHRPVVALGTRQSVAPEVLYKSAGRTECEGLSAIGAAPSAAAAAAAAALVGTVGAASRRSRQQRKRVSAVQRCATAMEVPVDSTEASSSDSSAARSAVPMYRIMGLEDVKLALRLACIDPSLGGVGICGGHGTAKTTLARSLRGILPKIEVVDRSICNADPEKPEEWDKLTRERMQKDADGNPVTKVIDCPFVELPLGCTEDRLVGSLDVQASMEQGRPVFEPGLLAKAHRGVLYIDDVNLLQDDLVSLLLTAVESGINQVEREGLSVRHPCRPLVVATWNPEEGPLRPHLMDRLAVALNTDVQTVYTDLDERISAVASSLEWDAKPYEERAFASGETQQMQTQLLFAREFLTDVKITEDQLRRFAQESSRGMCEGHRAEVFAAKIARAHAALNGREFVSADDVQQGIKLAILPRIRVKDQKDEDEEEGDEQEPQKPPPREEFDEEGDDDDNDKDDDADDDAPPPEEEEEGEEQEEEPEDDPDAEEDASQQELPEEFMISAEGAIVDEDLLKFSGAQKKSGRSGKGNKIYSMDRGRYVKAMLPKGGDAKNGRIALDATLRNAVVFQKMRREEAELKNLPRKNVYVEKSDIWVKKMARKAGALVIFVVDASGSMALNRMQNAKGAVLRLLENAYQNRDQVALIPCRGMRADILVQPTSSVAKASGSMQVLPCGGGTPLAHALSQAISIGNKAIASSDVGQVCIVAITDGRANVPLSVSENMGDMIDETGKMKKVSKEDLNEEVMAMADRLRSMGFKFLLIDTENKYVSSGAAAKLAERAAGRYYYLPRADDQAIAGIASSAIAEMRNM